MKIELQVERFYLINEPTCYRWTFVVLRVLNSLFILEEMIPAVICVSRHNRGSSKASLKPLNMIVMWWSERFQGGLFWAAIMPRDANLSDGCTSPHCCSNSSLHTQRNIFQILLNQTKIRLCSWAPTGRSKGGHLPSPLEFKNYHYFCL